MSLELDSTAGYRLYWKKHDTRGVVFLDKRAKVKPDIVADAKHLPFRENAFDTLHSDPPHVILPKPPKHREDWRNHPSFRGRKFNEEHHIWTMPEIIEEKFTSWRSRDELVEFLRETNNEYWRVLRANGTMILKIIDGKGKATINARLVRDAYTNFSEDAEIHMRKVGGLITNHAVYLIMHPRRDPNAEGPTRFLTSFLGEK